MQCVASQAFRRSTRLLKKCEIRPEIQAFREFGFISRRPFRRFWRANRRKSPATSGIIPVLWRLRPETGFDLHCAGRLAVISTAVSSRLLSKFGIAVRALRDEARSTYRIFVPQVRIHLAPPLLISSPYRRLRKSQISRGFRPRSSRRIWRAASAALHGA